MDNKKGQAFLFNDPQENKIKVSPHTFILYDTCPLRYKKLYIDKEKEFRLIPEATCGSLIHNILAKFLDQNATKIEQRNQIYLIDLLDDKWSTVKINDETKKEKLYLETRDILLSFYNNYKNEQPVVIEKGFNYTIDNIVLRGQIDRVDKQGDKIEVIDYKNFTEPYNVDEILYAWQTIFYFFGVKSLLSTYPNKMTYFFVKENKKVSCEYPQNYKEDATNKIRKMVNKIVNAQDFLPRVNNRCRLCGFKKVCPEFKN